MLTKLRTLLWKDKTVHVDPWRYYGVDRLESHWVPPGTPWDVRVILKRFT